MMSVTCSHNAMILSKRPHFCMYLSTVFYRKKDLYTISNMEIFIFHLNLMTLRHRPAFNYLSLFHSFGTPIIPFEFSAVYTVQLLIYSDQYAPSDPGVRYSRIPFIAIAWVEISISPSRSLISSKKLPALSTTELNCSIPSGAGLWAKSLKNVSISGGK